RFSRFTILSGGLVILAGGLVLSALSPNFWTLFAARALMGFGAAAISPMCSAIGAGLSAPEQQGRAIGIVFAGLTFATVLGTPMSGAWLAPRPLRGFAAAALTPVGSALGAGLSAPERQARATGIVFAGLTFAAVLGTPLSAWLGTVMEWRKVMALLAGLTLAC